jgi:hypothetical protein
LPALLSLWGRGGGGGRGEEPGEPGDVVVATLLVFVLFGVYPPAQFSVLLLRLRFGGPGALF